MTENVQPDETERSEGLWRGVRDDFRNCLLTPKDAGVEPFRRAFL